MYRSPSWPGEPGVLRGLRRGANEHIARLRWRLCRHLADKLLGIHPGLPRGEAPLLQGVLENLGNPGSELIRL